MSNFAPSNLRALEIQIKQAVEFRKIVAHTNSETGVVSLEESHEHITGNIAQKSLKEGKMKWAYEVSFT